jgi:hypothetical protein
MLVGIGILWAFILTLGNNLIRSRLDRLRTSSINKSSTAQNIMRQKKEIDNGLLALSSSSSSSMPILDATKALITIR